MYSDKLYKEQSMSTWSNQYEIRMNSLQYRQTIQE